MPVAKKAAPKSTPPDVDDYAKDVTIDLLLKKAFPHGAFAHIGEWIENAHLAPEVADVLRAAVERNA